MLGINTRIIWGQDLCKNVASDEFCEIEILEFHESTNIFLVPTSIPWYSLASDAEFKIKRDLSEEPAGGPEVAKWEIFITGEN